MQKASAMGIRLHDDSRDDATVQFCSGKCYYVMMAQNKVILSADQLAAAEGQADEETMGKLKQIHAENLAKCINQGKVRDSVIFNFPIKYASIFRYLKNFSILIDGRKI